MIHNSFKNQLFTLLLMRNFVALCVPYSHTPKSAGHIQTFHPSMQDVCMCALVCMCMYMHLSVYTRDTTVITEHTLFSFGKTV